MEEFRPRLNREEWEVIRGIRNSKKGGGVLEIGDLHEPFCLDDYLDFCIEQKNRYKCDKIVFLGDVIDNHYASYHETDPDGLSAVDELNIAIERIQKWRDAFPEAVVIIGNHDRLVMRKAFTAGISKKWIKSYKEVLETPNWEFKEEHILNDVLYVHGEGGGAIARAKADLISTVQGHRHTEAYTNFVVGKNFKIFGKQVGCGIDKDSYAMAYAKAGKKPAIGVGVTLDYGRLPFNVMMDL
jgi:hypothetical protein